MPIVLGFLRGISFHLASSGKGNLQKLCSSDKDAGCAEDADSTPSEQVDDDDSESLAPEHGNADLNLGNELQDTCNQVEVIEEEAFNMTVEVERVGTAGREVCSVDTVIFPTCAV
jgi:hypothetical protein